MNSEVWENEGVDPIVVVYTSHRQLIVIIITYYIVVWFIFQSYFKVYYLFTCILVERTKQYILNKVNNFFNVYTNYFFDKF